MQTHIEPRNWAHFVEQHWERAATVWDNTAAPLLPQVDRGALFEAVVSRLEESVRSRAAPGPAPDDAGLRLHRPAATPPRMYLGTDEVDLAAAGHDVLMPRASDRDFSGYDARLKGLGVKDYCVVVPDWHAFAPDLIHPLLEAVATLASHVGVSRARTDTQLFMGDYRITPFGAHVDPTSSFHVPVLGTKRMRLWSPEQAREQRLVTGQQSYDRAAGASTLLEARPGEVMYWPSSAWHVAESDGELSVTWGLGYWMGDSTRDLVSSLARARWSDSGAHSSSEPADVHAAMQHLQAIVSDPELTRAALRYWLEHTSALGFWRMPRLASVEIAPSGRYRARDGGRSMAWAPWNGTHVCVAARGHACLVDDTPAMRRVLERLVAGHEVDTDDTAAPVLKHLLRAGAVVC